MNGLWKNKFLSQQGENNSICRHVALPACRTVLSSGAFQCFEVLAFFFQISSLTQLTVLLAGTSAWRQDTSSRVEGWRQEPFLTSSAALLMLNLHALVYIKLFLQALLGSLKSELG